MGNNIPVCTDCVHCKVSGFKAFRTQSDYTCAWITRKSYIAPQFDATISCEDARMGPQQDGDETCGVQARFFMPLDTSGV